jgi:YggT family protein
MPNTGGVDFSPMILIFGLRLLVQLLFFLASMATAI